MCIRDSCYVCLEPCGPSEVSACTCRANVHAACLQTLVVARGSTHCGICKEPINNVRTTQKWVLRMSALVACRVATVLSGLFLDGIAIWCLYEACVARSEKLLVIFLSFSIIFGAVGTCACWLFFRMNAVYGRSACMFVQRPVVHVEDAS